MLYYDSTHLVEITNVLKNVYEPLPQHFNHVSYLKKSIAQSLRFRDGVTSNRILADALLKLVHKV